MGMSFGQALEHLKAGSRVARQGWNGKNMWIALIPGVVIPEKGVTGIAKQLVPTGDLTVLSHIVMWTANGEWLPGWLASQTDMLASDWLVLGL